jgi:hypothetical protein
VGPYTTHRRQSRSSCQKRSTAQDPANVPRFGARALQRRSSGRLCTTKVRSDARGACVARYYDPSTGQFLSIDPAVALTAAPYSYVGDDPLNGVDPSGLCSRWNPFCPIVTAANWVGREVNNHALAAAETFDCISDIAECTNNPEAHANYQAGIENSLLQLGGVGASIPEPYPCASPGSYQAGELFPYIAIAAATGVSEALGAEAAAVEADGGAWVSVDAGSLQGNTLSNYGRFLKSLPSSAEQPTVTLLPGGYLDFSASVPATNIHGSYATYIKVLNFDGVTVAFWKTTFAPDGSIVSVKIKYP